MRVMRDFLLFTWSYLMPHSTEVSRKREMRKWRVEHRGVVGMVSTTRQLTPHISSFHPAPRLAVRQYAPVPFTGIKNLCPCTMHLRPTSTAPEQPARPSAHGAGQPLAPAHSGTPRCPAPRPAILWPFLVAACHPRSSRRPAARPLAPEAPIRAP